ncbi:DDE Tnp4 domain-containing protein [Mycena kentingensis (nom. inval.)]|nr:DDE Tnp4 domain-containing protein [Mycena kentingensis (nom. inval.)]
MPSHKAFKQMEKKDRKNLKFWTDGVRYDLLSKHLEGYLDASAKGWRAKRAFWQGVCNEYHGRISWRVGDDEEPHALGEYDPLAPVVEENLTPEETRAKWVRINILNLMRDKTIDCPLMPRLTAHEQVSRSYMTWMCVRDAVLLDTQQDAEFLVQKLSVDIETLRLIRNTRYLAPREPVAKAGSLHLAWIYKTGTPSDQKRFENMLRMSPYCFDVLLQLIQDHPIFTNNSNNPQAPVEEQLAVTLYRMGRYGNGASVQDIARTAGCSEGSVENFTNRVFTAIESLHDLFVRPLTEEEKDREKQWVEDSLGFGGLWREGWIMYDGTIVPLFTKPALNGQGYYTRKSNYGLNVQIGNTPSNLRIVDYSIGHTGSAHDQLAFEGTAAYRYPDWLFKGLEFGWFDSAYTLTGRSIPIIKEPDAQQPDNMAFNKSCSHLRLRVMIESNSDHEGALRWIMVAIILHNMIIEIEGAEAGAAFGGQHERIDEEEDRGEQDEPIEPSMEAGRAKRQQLVDELAAVRAARAAAASDDDDAE